MGRLFTNMSGDPEQEYFADGMVDDIITALSHFKALFVIARNSSFTYKGRAVDVKQAGRELGVRYVLEGSIRKAANRVRITGQLVDTATGAHLWADRFDGGLGDVFDLQDQVTESVVGAIAPAVEKAEIERARRKPTESLDAYAFYLRGLAKLYQVASRQANEEALRLFNSAIELDPNFSSAYGRAAHCYAIAEELPMQTVTTIGFDIAKSVFQVHGVDAADQVVIRRQLKRRQVLTFFEKLPPAWLASRLALRRITGPAISRRSAIPCD